MARAFVGGLFYFAIVFAAGFALGVVRILYLEPKFGATAAVLLELPIILTVSWIACGFVLQHAKVDTRLSTRLAMGGVAFAILILAEVALGVVGSGRTLAGQFAEMGRAPGLIGLGGQMLFALFPAMRRLR